MAMNRKKKQKHTIANTPQVDENMFKIETSIGTYNPDWAIYMDKDGVEKLYCVIETKGTTRLEELRGDEESKIKCGAEHFPALNNGVVFPQKPESDRREFKVGV
jgi:type III restriction enzyme